MKKMCILTALLLAAFTVTAQVSFVKDINTNKEIVSTEPGEYSGFLKAGSWLYFEAATETGQGLWKTDGTTAGTSFIKDIGTADGNNNHLSLEGEYLGKLLYTADDGEHGNELWISDGTEAGTTLTHGRIENVSSCF